MLREEIASTRGTAPSRKRKSAPVDLSEADALVYEGLRELRKELAKEQGVPPYVIFHDATLREMAELQPRTEQELLGINGVGQAKLDKYGVAFLAELDGGTPAEADSTESD